MTDQDDVACQELVELVTEYLEAALSDADRSRFEAHIAGCEGCFTYLDQMRETIRLTGRVPTVPPSAETRRRLLEAFRRWKPR